MPLAEVNMDKAEAMANVGFQFITHFADGINYRRSAEIALAGGCRWIQLRIKAEDDIISTPQEREALALEIKAMCHSVGATFIIDDDVELAKKVGADGVHLGLRDMPIAKARAILGDNYIVGGTANCVEHIVAHHSSGADYIGMGPFRFTSTKRNLSPILGLKGYATACQELKAMGIKIPIVAIGGITTEDIPQILQTGVDGVALSSLIIGADNPNEECQKIIKMINQNG